MSRASSWQSSMLSRFDDRDDLGQQGAIRSYWSDLPESEVAELLSFIELEYGLPSGLLRPNDPVAKLMAPVPTRNPLKWMVYQTRSGDRNSELNWKVARKLREHNLEIQLDAIRTVDDLVRAWCGDPPKSE